MLKKLLFVSLFTVMGACIPIRIAPSIKDYKIHKGQKFKNNLPKRQMFIFKDPKPAFEFYHYINNKFSLEDINVQDDVPFTIGENQYFFSFYEVEISHKTINVIPIAADIVMASANLEPTFENVYKTRKGNWYIAIEVYSDIEQDCLLEKSPSFNQVTTFLAKLKEEYLSTYSYNEVLFKR